MKTCGEVIRSQAIALLVPHKWKLNQLGLAERNSTTNVLYGVIPRLDLLFCYALLLIALPRNVFYKHLRIPSTLALMGCHDFLHGWNNQYETLHQRENVETG